MTLFWLAVSFVCGIIVASLLWRREIGPPPKKESSFDGVSFPFDKRETLLNEGELVLYRTLQRELAKEYLILPKVRLGEIVQLNRKSSREHFYKNLVQSRHVDLLLCDRESIAPIMAIQVAEKDDHEHDVTFDVLKSAELLYLRLSPKKVIAPSELAFLISEAVRARRKRDTGPKAQVLR